MSLSRSAAAAFFIALRRFSKVGSSAMGVRGYPGMDVPFLGYRRIVAKTIRVAAAGDIHAGSAERDRVAEAFQRVEAQSDLILLAGDLTQHGQVDQVCVVADACRGLQVPVVAVLGNHDWQSDRPADLVRALAEAGVVVLDRTHTILPIGGVSVGVAGVKGFVGGFGNQWANFGEPLFREAYAETTKGSSAGSLRSSRVRCALRCSITRPSRRRSSESRNVCGSCSAPTGLRDRSVSTAPISSCTGMRITARSKAT